MAWPVVKLYTDEAATPENLNRPLQALIQRTAELRQRQDQIAGDPRRRSIRLADVPLDREQIPDAPCVVYFDAAEGVYRPALATVALDRPRRDLDDKGYAVGVLIYADPVTATGTVVRGYVEGLNMSVLMADGVEFAPGPLYLSAEYPGKLVRVPTGPTVLVGVFGADEALITPQARDFAEAHVHRQFHLAHAPQGPEIPIYAVGYDVLERIWLKGLRPNSAQDAFHGDHTGANGSQDLEDTGAGFGMDDFRGVYVLNVTKGVYGVVLGNTSTELTTVMAGGATWDNGDQYFLFERARLVVTGPTEAGIEVEYTVWVADQSGTNAPNWVNEFDDVWLHWTSTDPAEPAGSTPIYGYDQDIPIGNKGFSVRLENMVPAYARSDPSGGAMQVSGLIPAAFAAIPEGWGAQPLGEHDPDWRTWTFRYPDDVRGWRQHDIRKVANAADAEGVSVTLRSENYDYDARALRLVCGHTAELTWTALTPAVGSQVTVSGNVFEFTSGAAVTAGATPVTLVSGDAQATFENLAREILDLEIPGVTVALPPAGATGRFWLVVDHTDRFPVVGTGSNLMVDTSISGTNPAQAVPPVRSMLLDDEHRWIPHSSGDSSVLRFWDATYLDGPTGLAYYARNSEMDGTTAPVPAVEPGAVFFFDVSDQLAAGDFEYTMDLDPAFRSVWPPQPRDSGVLVWGGSEVPSITDTPNGYYAVLLQTLVSRMGLIPWHADGEWSKFYMPIPRVGENGIVRSLRAADESGLSIRRCGADTLAATGDLEIDFKLALRTMNENLTDWNVVKGVRQQKLLRGPVVSKIRDGSWYRVQSRRGAPHGQGEVELVLDGLNSEGGFESIALENGKTGVIGMFPYIKLLPRTSSVRSGFVARFAVPWQLQGAWQLMLDFHAFGLANAPAGARQTFGLDVTYNILRAYDPAIEAGSTLTGDLVESAQTLEWAIPLGTESAGYQAFAPVVVHTNPQQPADEPNRIYRADNGPFPRANDLKGGVAEPDLSLLVLRPGTNVAVRFENAVRGDTPYEAELGIMNLRWKLVPIL